MTQSRRLTIAGIVLILGGILSILLPLAAGLGVTLFVGWAFLISGLVQAWQAVTDAEDRWTHAIFALLGLFLGVSFLLDPLGGLVSLTILVGILFLASGALRIWLAWTRRERSGFWMLLISGALSVILGAFILADLQGAGLVALGLLFGIELLSLGVGLVAMARMARRDAQDG